MNGSIANIEELTKKYKEELYDDYKEEDVKESYKQYTIKIVSKMAYLLGVGADVFEKEPSPYDRMVYEELKNNKNATIIRYLCKMRNVFMKKYGAIENRIKYELENITKMDDLFDMDNIKYLQDNGFQIVRFNTPVQKYVVEINKYIVEHINSCKSIFPLWIEWEYIKNLFIMPGGLMEHSVKTAKQKYSNNFTDYPFQIYMGWVPHGKGNFIHNDKKFLELLYEHHGNVFDDISKVTDASVSTRKSIYNYLEENGDTVIVVDCENSDPYKLCGVLKSLKSVDYNKIKKIMLLNDVHTSTAWQIIEQFLKIPVENILIERIKENKSLVDIKVTTETCREHYVNHINSFILCSSDSDYWGLITALKQANFLVMVEKAKCSKDMRDAMELAGITYCSMDDFTTGDINNVKVKVLSSQMKEYIQERVSLNVNEMLDYVYTQTRIRMSPSEKKQFYDNYVKSMRLCIRDNGDVEIVIKEK